MSFEPLVRVCTKTKCRRRRPLAKMFIRLGPSGGGAPGVRSISPTRPAHPVVLRPHCCGTGFGELVGAYTRDRSP
jgi:hypothetical protein